MFRLRPICLAALLAAALPLTSLAEDAPGKPLLDVTKKGDLVAAGLSTETPDEVSFTPSSDAAHPGIDVSITPGKAGYPGIIVAPPKSGNSSWDLSKFGHISAKVTNLSDKNMSVALRVDNSGGGPEPWNTEVFYFKPNESKTLKVIFGYAYGNAAYKLDSSKIVKVLLFSGKPKDPISWRLESLEAGGTTGETPPAKPVDPNTIRVAPNAGGILLGKGGLEAKTFKAEGNAAVKEITAEGWKVRFDKKGQFASLKPTQGRWDFRLGLQAVFTIKNTGTTAATPALRLESNDKKSERITSDAPVAPGAVVEVTVPFAAKSTWNSAEKDSGSQFSNHRVSAIVLSTDTDAQPVDFTVTGIKVSLPPTPKLPEWLGKRPPVDGDWKVTLDEEFDGATVNDKLWNIYGENYWDKTTHFSKENVFVKDGTATLRVTKKHGFQNDDPNHKRQTDYATGFLDSYGKWTQLYGYFEARTKLTSSPGVWPAFWIMPERGGSDPQWKRASTSDGGMEFDVMEHLSGWGIYRYNIAMHWDGYDKNHKSVGTSAVYVQPDKDGFITTGLLWTPGLAVFYANGQEVGRHENPRVSSVPSDIMFTLPMGGWDNLPMDDKQLPADFVVDYVRVWQRADLAK